ncbi:DUF5642 family protein [Gordonia sp. HY442]|uniref:DUF5642 family protein n=1 Tax=Gordonia zhenghanii TaxID=2911516 RepID=UPI001F3C9E33|nr:DUF5642 family protein [Gordonia zhenghanii]MCF8607623.1 DUF5642 family protein [Gordonia zhenghanii]
MRTRHLVAILAATGIAFATASCGSADDGDATSGADSASTSEQAAPAASAQELLLTADEFPRGSEFTILPKASVDQVFGNMTLPEGAVVDPPECADKATVVDTLTGKGDAALTAGSAENQQLLLGEAVVKNGPSVADLRDANQKCPTVEYSGDNVTSKGSVEIGDDPQVKDASDAVEFTATTTGQAMDVTLTTTQYGVAAEVDGVVFLVTVTSLNNSGKVTPETKSQVLEIANAQAAKISKAA